ncbi:uncharacterized protein BKA78DRAFT_296828 [Phyllosticta capitalensis]|uniref:uncharacterized protein n=1 Tax=Phyllosticta capitalensis TaxID=121624 RepID=UPI00312E1CCD
MRNLDSLPFDVLFEVSRYLGLADVLALGWTSRQLRAAVRGEEALARLVVKNNAPVSREAQLAAASSSPPAPSPSSSSPSSSQNAPNNSTSYRRALFSIHARRNAFATARPRSACIVDHGVADFVGGEGVLCYVYAAAARRGGDEANENADADAVRIRAVDLEDGGRQIAELDAGAIVRRVVQDVCGEEDDGDDGDGASARRRRNGSEAGAASRSSSATVQRRETQQDDDDDDDDAIQECGNAHRAAACLGFTGRLQLQDEDAVDAESTARTEGRSRSASPCLPAGWSTLSSTTTSGTARRAGGGGAFGGVCPPRVTLVQYSASILSVYVNFSACWSGSTSSSPLKQHPHYLVAIRLPTNTNTDNTSTVALRVFRLPNRLEGYGSDNSSDWDCGSSDGNGETTMSAEGESDGAGRGLKLFVRNTASHYYFGTHTGRRQDGKRVWVVHGVELNETQGRQDKCSQGRQTTANGRKKQRDGHCGVGGEVTRLVLPHILSTALGVEASFFIHGEWFYGLTNYVPSPNNTLTGFHNFPPDWRHYHDISVYLALRFPLASPEPGAVEVNAPVFRRHLKLEGPIHDSWTALEAVADERDGEVRVVEGMRECGGGQRSWYFGNLGFGGGGGGGGEEEEEEEEQAGLEETDGVVDDGGQNPAGANLETAASVVRGSSALAQNLGETSSFFDPWDASPLDTFLPDLDGDLPSNDTTHSRERPWLRHPQRVHRECFHDAAAARSFTLSRTKHRAYNYSAAAFLDLVEDERCCGKSGAMGESCLRMRVGARRQRVGRDTTAAVGHGDPGHGHDEMQRQKDMYAHGRVSMWPPASSSPVGKASSPSPDGKASSSSPDGKASSPSPGGKASCRCAKKLHAIMNAPLQPDADESRSSFAPAPAIDVVAMTDERSVVFLRRPKYGGATARTGPLVLVSFDDGIAAQGLDGQTWKREQCSSCT